MKFFGQACSRVLIIERSSTHETLKMRQIEKFAKISSRAISENSKFAKFEKIHFREILKNKYIRNFVPLRYIIDCKRSCFLKENINYGVLEICQVLILTKVVIPIKCFYIKMWH